MTYMWPSYLPVLMDYEHPRYRLWLYQEGIQLTDPAKAHAIVTAARGSAVLFIPGNGGSYKQVRQPFFHPFLWFVPFAFAHAGVEAFSLVLTGRTNRQRGGVGGVHSVHMVSIRG
jgi:hypothetical protein